MADWLGVDMTNRICLVPGCGRPHRARGYCRRCYDKAKHNGEFVPSPHRSMTPEQWYWYAVRPSDGCWEWTGRHDVLGYSLIYIEGKYRKAHRFSYELHIGQIPADLHLDHLCRNRGCVNPQHLEPVTLVENIMRGNGAAAQAARRTHCPQGHPYFGDNLVLTDKGYRVCRTCRRKHDRDNKRKARQAARVVKPSDVLGKPVHAKPANPDRRCT